MPFCDTCGGYYTGNNGKFENLFPVHKCPPVYRCWDENYTGLDEEDGWDVHATDAEDAAEKAAEHFDDNCGEGPDTRTVKVRAPDGKITEWHVGWDTQIIYSAREKT